MPLRVCVPPIRHSIARIKIRTPRHFSRSRFLRRDTLCVCVFPSLLRGWRSRASGKTHARVASFVAQPRPFTRKQCSRYTKECGIFHGGGREDTGVPNEEKGDVRPSWNDPTEISIARIPSGRIPSPFIGFLKESRRRRY